ncbi:MAG: KH domain-containing protein [Candidatus Marinimicrobia bacterium]|nr:KH domain-containing protein [Candidatus Neomarinimicrobiota bacterium]
MQEFVEFIAKRLVDNPDEVKVTQVDSENNVIYELVVNPADLGKVIGKSGRTAQALRTLLTAVSAKSGGRRATLDIIDN